MIKTAVVIAGGEGSRLRPFTYNKPKTLIKIGGKPILQWIIELLKSYGIKHIILGVAYKKEKIYQFMKNNNNFGLKVDFSEHTVEGGTAQAFKFAIERFVTDSTFLGINGDELTNINIFKLVEKHEMHKPLVTMALAPFHCRFSVVKFERDHKITEFEYGAKLRDIPISIGLYVFNHQILNHIPSRGSIEDLVFAKLAKEGKMRAYMLSAEEDWISINTMKDLNEAEGKIKAWNSEH